MGHENITYPFDVIVDSLFHVQPQTEDLTCPLNLQTGSWDPRKKARMIAPEFGGNNHKRDDSHKYPDPLVAFPAHWAPMQMTFYTCTQFPARYRNGAFISFHGSWNRAPLPQAGYRVAFVPFNAAGNPTGSYLRLMPSDPAGIGVPRQR